MFSNLSSSLVKCTAQRLNYIMYIYNRRLSVNTNSFPFPLFFHYLAIPLEIHLVKALVTVPPTNLLNICIFHFLSFESILQTVTMCLSKPKTWSLYSYLQCSQFDGYVTPTGPNSNIWHQPHLLFPSFCTAIPFPSFYTVLFAVIQIYQYFSHFCVFPLAYT